MSSDNFVISNINQHTDLDEIFGISRALKHKAYRDGLVDPEEAEKFAINIAGPALIQEMEEGEIEDSYINKAEEWAEEYNVEPDIANFEFAPRKAAERSFYEEVEQQIDMAEIDSIISVDLSGSPFAHGLAERNNKPLYFCKYSRNNENPQWLTDRPKSSEYKLIVDDIIETYKTYNGMKDEVERPRKFAIRRQRPNMRDRETRDNVVY